MRALVVVGTVIGLCCGVSAAFGAGAAKPAPSHGEIARGVEAAARCESVAWSTEDYSSCIDQAMAKAMDEDRASMPFQLGIYCSAFSELASAYSARAWKRSMIDSDTTEAAAVDQYGSCVFAARSIGLDMRRICSALGVTCTAFNRMLRHWQQVRRRGG